MAVIQSEFRNGGEKDSGSNKILESVRADLQNKIAERTQAKANKGKGLDQERENLARIVEKMDKMQLKKINELLQKSSPSTLVAGLESLVALLRNHKTATNVDVELYFQDFTKLTLKLQRIEAASLSKEYVEKHHKALKAILPSFS